MALLDFPEKTTPTLTRFDETLWIIDKAREVVGSTVTRIRREFELSSDPDSPDGAKEALRWVIFIESVKKDFGYLNIESIADVQSIISRIRRDNLVDQVEAMLMDYMLRIEKTAREIIRNNLAEVLASLNVITLRDARQSALGFNTYYELLKKDEWLVPLLLLRTVEF